MESTIQKDQAAQAIINMINEGYGTRKGTDHIANSEIELQLEVLNEKI